MSHRQADQLAVAVRSPIASQKHQHCGRVEVRRKTPWSAGLVRQAEVGEHHLTITVTRSALRGSGPANDAIGVTYDGWADVMCWRIIARCSAKWIVS